MATTRRRITSLQAISPDIVHVLQSAPTYSATDVGCTVAPGPISSLAAIMAESLNVRSCCDFAEDLRRRPNDCSWRKLGTASNICPS